MSAGLYVLEAGGSDPQSPHAQDEIYHVLAGRARFTSGGEERAVAPGDVLFVPAQEEHRFHSVDERLSLLVVFAPAEG
jgi:mannose-6-phosphate isomerase-like protein (cupin superfamily)